ncbi:MAG: class I SAM-dependent methyltransferase [Streptococcaceae bacterium]|nr:class I SAM-dependent methyltransferase [Streptococcaceae bacterium]
MKLSKRLREVAACVPENARVADIGSDHAKVPIWLVEKGISDYVVAGEVALGPYEIAREAVHARPEIQVRLADGLSALTEADAIDCVIIAGMGGLLIAEILAAGNLSGLTTLILQPNNHEEALRRWLNRQNFTLSEEKMVADKGKIYEIIVAKRGAQALSEEALRYGNYARRHPIFRKKWQFRLTEIAKVLEILKMSDAASSQAESEKLRAEKIEIERMLSNENQ